MLRAIVAALILASGAVGQWATYRNITQPRETRDPITVWIRTTAMLGGFWGLNAPPTKSGGWPHTWRGTKIRWLMYGVDEVRLDWWHAFPHGMGIVGEGWMFTVPVAMLPMPIAPGELYVEVPHRIPDNPSLIGRVFLVQAMSWWDNPEGDDVVELSNALRMVLGR